MATYRIVRRARSVDIIDAYGRCVDTVMDPGAYAGAPEPQLAPTDSYLSELVKQGERSGRYEPTNLETQRTYDSVTDSWSTQLWPKSDS